MVNWKKIPTTFKHLTAKMEFTLLSLMILVVMVVVLHISKEGKRCPKKKEADEENGGRTAVTEKRDEQNMPYKQALQNENFQRINSQSNPRDNPHATDNQTKEETSTGIETQPQGLQLQTPQTGTGVPTPEFIGIDIREPPQVTRKDGDVQVPQIENEDLVPWTQKEQATVSFSVIAFSGTMIGTYSSLLGSNKQISDYMVAYELGIWLLHFVGFFGFIMLGIAISRPCTHSLRAFHWFLILAAGSAACAIGIEAYLLLPKSTIRLVIFFVLTAALLIFLFQDKIVRSFQVKQHPN